jgi:antitoxin ParD1/3/4
MYAEARLYDRNRELGVPHGKSHQVDLTPDIESAIRRRVDSGAYQSDIDVIRAGLLALDRHEKDVKRRLVAFDASIARGLADADARRVRPAEEVFDELREHIRRKVENRKE